PVCVATNQRHAPSMADDGQGGAYLVWDDYRDYSISASDLYLQRVVPEGAIGPGWPVNGRKVSTELGFQFNGVVVSDGPGGAFVAYENYGYYRGVPADRTAIYAQHVKADGDLQAGWPAPGMPLVDLPTDSQRANIIRSGVLG